MKNSYLFLILLLLVIGGSACTFNGKVEDEEPPFIEPPIQEIEQFSFEYPVKFELDSAIFEVGDTLRLEVEIPNSQLINLFNRDTVNFIRPFISFNYTLFRLDEMGTGNSPFFSLDFFFGESLHNSVSQFQASYNWFVSFGCPEPGEPIQFKMLMVFKKAGTYALELSTASVQWGPGMSCNFGPTSGVINFGELNLFFYPYHPRLDLVRELPENVQNNISFLFPDHPSLINQRVTFFRVD